MKAISRCSIDIRFPAVRCKRRGRRRKSPRRRYEDGQRRAAVRAFTAAALRLGIPHQAPIAGRRRGDVAAAIPPYVVAAAAVLQSGDAALIADALYGRVPLLEAAKSVRKKLELVRAFGRASAEDRRALGLAFGPDKVFDEVVIPALNR